MALRGIYANDEDLQVYVCHIWATMYKFEYSLARHISTHSGTIINLVRKWWFQLLDCQIRMFRPICSRWGSRIFFSREGGGVRLCKKGIQGKITPSLYQISYWEGNTYYFTKDSIILLSSVWQPVSCGRGPFMCHFYFTWARIQGYFFWGVCLKKTPKQAFWEYCKQYQVPYQRYIQSKIVQA
jgi:hypothetical protein